MTLVTFWHSVNSCPSGQRTWIDRNNLWHADGHASTQRSSCTPEKLSLISCQVHFENRIKRWSFQICNLCVFDNSNKQLSGIWTDWS